MRGVARSIKTGSPYTMIASPAQSAVPSTSEYLQKIDGSGRRVRKESYPTESPSPGTCDYLQQIYGVNFDVPPTPPASPVATPVPRPSAGTRDYLTTLYGVQYTPSPVATSHIPE